MIEKARVSSFPMGHLVLVIRSVRHTKLDRPYLLVLRAAVAFL